MTRSSATVPACWASPTAITEAEKIIRQNATGFDLTPLYSRLPPALSGMVELAYDSSNQPSMRFIKPLVYESSAYTEDRQSVQLSLETGVERPFILSTPRLPSPDVLELRIPFRHPGLEELFRARVRPATEGALREALELNADQAQWLDRLLTSEPDLASDRHIDSGGRIRYFGHACLVMQTPQAAIVTDPWVNADTAASGRFTYRDLPDYIDAVLITHGHQSSHRAGDAASVVRGRVGTVVVPRFITRRPVRPLDRPLSVAPGSAGSGGRRFF